MGVEFDKLYYESQTYVLGKQRRARRTEEGRVLREGRRGVGGQHPDGLDEKVLLRRDGTSVYMTQDIGTADQALRGIPRTIASSSTPWAMSRTITSRCSS